MSYTLKYTLYGAVFGLCFPVSATLLETWLNVGNLTFQALIQSQVQNPMIWMIDTAPIFLGMFAYLGGLQYDKLTVSQAEKQNIYELLETKNRELENQVQARTAQLESNIIKLVAANQIRSEFIATISHELRTPLTAIGGAIKLIKSNTVGNIDKQGMALIELADRNTNRLSSLVNDILDIEKIEAGKLQFELDTYSVAKLIEEAVGMSQPYAESFGVNLMVDDLDESVKISTDKRRFIQILLNILSNACKFSSADSTVSVNVIQKDKKLRINVVDQGQGISQSLEKTVFDKFVQGDSSSNRSRNGTGLGLSVSKALVESMGGKIGFYPNEEHGTVFFIEYDESQE